MSRFVRLQYRNNEAGVQGQVLVDLEKFIFVAEDDSGGTISGDVVREIKGLYEAYKAYTEEKTRQDYILYSLATKQGRLS